MLGRKLSQSSQQPVSSGSNERSSVTVSYTYVLGLGKLTGLSVLASFCINSIREMLLSVPPSKHKTKLASNAAADRTGRYAVSQLT